MEEEVGRIERELSLESTWSLPEKIQELQKKKSKIEYDLLPFKAADDKLAYIEGSMDILQEEGGDLFLKEIQGVVIELKETVNSIELSNLLSGEMDRNNAIVSIHPGAGGIESQDWAQMLMRMYIKWAEKKGFAVEIIDIQPGEEGGIKGVTFTLSGLYAYGYIKTEAGVHRLVRISPFDSNKRRHTSFSAVLVYPEVEEDISVDIKEEDLKIDTYRASGAGGQHVNKTSSAVRITHIPTGIVVACQNERSQHKNRATAMKVIKARLYDLYLREHEKKIDSFVGDKKDITWGSQIRSYTLQPYRLIKDHRTGTETGNVDAVLNGDINMFIYSCLKFKGKK